MFILKSQTKGLAFLRSFLALHGLYRYAENPDDCSVTVLLQDLIAASEAQSQALLTLVVQAV